MQLLSLQFSYACFSHCLNYKMSFLCKSVFPLGAIIGGLCGLYTIEKYGRKFNVMLCSLLFVAGWITIAFAHSTLIAFAGRVITGFGVGISTFTIPVSMKLYYGEN